MARIDNINNFLTDVANSIRNKTGKTDDIPASEFDVEIESISGGGSEDLTEELTDYETNLTTQEITIQDIIKALEGKAIGGDGGKYAPRFISFYQYTGTDLSYELENLDTSNITSMENMFYFNKNLEELDLSHLDTSKVKNGNKMFYGCTSLKRLDVRNFDFTKLAYMDYMWGYNSSNGNIPSDCLIIVKDEANKGLIVNNAKLCSITLTNVKTVAELEG